MFRHLPGGHVQTGLLRLKPGQRGELGQREPRGQLRTGERCNAVVATTTLVFQLYKWWRPEHNDPHRYGTPGPPHLGVTVATWAPALRQMTSRQHCLGRELSDLVGHRPFVVDVSRNGIGPPPDGPAGTAQWCNPDQQALGVPPTTGTGQPGVDPLLWIKRPGESDGKCGGEISYFFSPRQARELIVNSPAVPAAARRAAEAAAAPPASTAPIG
jgi:hypothetical protein